MSDLKLVSSGGGSVTLTTPSTASNLTLTLPSASGTVATTSGTGSVFTNPTINGFTGDTSAITVGTTQFVKDISGNIGIGTSSPSTRLHVNGVSPIVYVVGSANAGVGFQSVTSLGNFQFGTGIGSATNCWNLYDVNAGAERMRLDSSGNLGLGVTPSAWRTDASTKALQIGNSTFFTQSSGGNYTQVGCNVYQPSSGQNTYIVSDYATKYQQYAGTHIWQTAPSGTAGNAITFTQAMTLDANQDLFVGTTAHPIVGRTNGVSLGKNGFKFRSPAGNNDWGISSTSGAIAYLYSDNGSAYVYAGSIAVNGNTATYNSVSDQRLKTDKGIATDTSVIDNTVVHDFEWKTNGSVDRGIFAQEAYLVKPSAITQGQSEELNEDGTPVHPWGVDYSKYVPDLIVYCQQLRAELNELKAKVSA